mmetsp:Transcript_27568/g.66443  ORF Transcript_27568/g.66443 Transcript_27568/m.66443 type:complete len:492 (-) Transcript_27568:41-1516(-)
MRVSLALSGVLAARISRDESEDTSSFVRHAVVDASGNIADTVEVAEHRGSARSQMLAQMQDRVSSLLQTKLTPEAKDVITGTLLPTVDKEIAQSILKEFETAQELLNEKVAALKSTTTATVAAKGRADAADQTLLSCREAQKGKFAEHEQCEADRAQRIAELNGECEAARSAAAAKKEQKEAAATFDLGSSVCSPEDCDVAKDPTCGLGDLAESVAGLQAQVKLKVERYTQLTQQLATADEDAMTKCSTAEKYPVENTCETQAEEAASETQKCSAAHETADLDKCNFGTFLQGKCADLTEVNALIEKIKASERTDSLSEPDRQAEWEATQRLKCLLEALRDEGDLSQDAAAQCAAAEDRAYPKTFDYKTAEIAELTSGDNFSCGETTITFSGSQWSVGENAEDFQKSEDVPEISLAVHSMPFTFCGGEEPAQCEITMVKKVSSSACTEGTSFGCEGNMMWVDKGCRADFQCNGKSLHCASRGFVHDTCECA